MSQSSLSIFVGEICHFLVTNYICCQHPTFPPAMIGTFRSASSRCLASVPVSRLVSRRRILPVPRFYSRTTACSKLQTAIVGLPNVGKSTLFNALTESANAAEVGNYPFCTIDPNKGIAIVPDERLEKLSELNNSEKTVPTTLEFVDVAGLIKGASKGEGLGNQFLASIRQCDAIIHVVRCFEDEDVIQ